MTHLVLILHHICTHCAIVDGHEQVSIIAAKSVEPVRKSVNEIYYSCTKMSGEGETTSVELAALEQNNGSQQINQKSSATPSSNKDSAEKDSKYWQYLEVALLSAVVVVVLLLMLLPTIFYHLPLPVCTL